LLRRNDPSVQEALFDELVLTMAGDPDPRHRQGAYDNPFAPDNVYGHALELLARHRVLNDCALHIDIGCGYGRIAEPLAARLGLTYVACDLDEDALRSLQTRGFETHRLFLNDEESIYQTLNTIIDGRELASISILDTLEHLDQPAATVRALQRIAAEHQSFVVISVPNTAHRDIALRLLFGRWDYTETGILDHTHRTLFSDSVLRRMLAHGGLHIIDANDVILTHSDQAFPATHPVFQPGTHLHRLLNDLRSMGDGFGSTNQLVRLCAAGPVTDEPPYAVSKAERAPLLSVLILTEGRNPSALIELTTCLAGQSVTDFELIVVGAGLDRPRQVLIEQVIEESPSWLRAQIRFLRFDTGNQSQLLNLAFAAASGRYITILQETDILFAHWAETFLHAANAEPGQILRSAAIRQDVRQVEFNFAIGFRAESEPQTPYPLGFDVIANMRDDLSPGVTLAFPRGLFNEINLSFDESLSAGAIWDYLLRAAGLAGVTSVGVITASVRSNPDSACNDARARAKILEKLDQSTAFLWPAGTTRRLRSLGDDISYLKTCLLELEQSNAEVALKLDHALAVASASAARNVDLAAELAQESSGAAAMHMGFRRALGEVLEIYGSTSWRVSAVLRLPNRLRGRRPANVSGILSLSVPELQALAAALRRSTSWRITAPLRLGRDRRL
jgi:2-polyprenyl-3-methyl-5-hydroxy-6-metoxy-1,4-benzoquinol methylase